MDPDVRLYDMILCDSVMPVMDGPTAVQIIRELGYKNPILGVTGNTLPEQIEDFVQHGVDEVIAKPVKANVIKDAMQKRLSEPCVIYSSKQN
jgi:CheY-like chemotaxis protein